MRKLMATAAAALLVAGCGGSSTTNGGDGGSGGGGGGGSCAAPSGTYKTHWTYVSGGSTCQQSLPMDSTGAVNPDAGISMAGMTPNGCVVTMNGCMYSATCDVPFGDASSIHIAESFSVQSDGSITGTVLESINFTAGTTTVMTSCTYGFMASKQ